MRKSSLSILLLISIMLTTSLISSKLLSVDASIVGFINMADGIGKIAHVFLETLDPEIKANLIVTSEIANNYDQASERVKQIVYSADKAPGKVAILTDLLWDMARHTYKFIPKESIVKIAYSMVEFSEIPVEWAKALNEEFDAVVVPDKWLVKTYKNSGVTIPIFVLPIITPIEKFLEQPVKKATKQPFVFGCMHPGKNTYIMMQAFVEAFGTSNAVKLKLHARNDHSFIASYIKEKKLEGYNNIEFDASVLSNADYISYMQQFDCYVTFSNGEGFSFPPREALALGKPVILSDNTALHTICETGSVLCIPSAIPMASDTVKWMFGPHAKGHYLQCALEDAKNAYITMYNNYNTYFAKAQQGREWVKSYLKSALTNKYRALVKPKVVILGDVNEIRDDGIVTNSVNLFNKYHLLMNSYEK